ncbi:MAG: LolA family protein [Acidimicrobiales bacterium]
MGDLGELLALLHDSAGRWAALTGELEEWTDPAAVLAGARRQSGRAGMAGPSTPPGAPGQADRSPREGAARVWAASGGRLRVEREAGGERLLVTRGERWSSLGPGNRVQSNEGERPHLLNWRRGLLGLMLEPIRLVLPFALTPRGESEAAGRPCLRAEGVERAGADSLGSVTVGADRVLLEVDAETGVVLGLETFLEGEPAQRIRFTSVTFDPSVDDSRFEFEAPEGAETAAAINPSTPPEDAARAVSFALYAPPRTRGEAPLAAILIDGRAGPPERGPLVMLHPLLPAPGGGWMIHESADEAHMPAVEQWEAVPLPQGGGHLWQAPEGEAHVRLTLGRTHIWIRGAPGRDEALRLAESLRPVHAGV